MPSLTRGSQSLTTVIEATPSGHCGHAVIKRIISLPSLPAAQLEPRPLSDIKFESQIIDLPDPHDPVLNQFQAEVLGEFGSALTPTQIVALRCYHPVLRQYKKVYFSTVGVSQYIVVGATSLNKDIKNPLPLPLKIGGYQIHSFPEIYTPSDRIIYPSIDLISTFIDPHRPLEPSVVKILKEKFTLSVGVQLLVFGHLILLFPDSESIRWTILHTPTMPLNIGSLTYSFDVLSITPSSQSTSTCPEPKESNKVEPPIYSRTAPINDRCNIIDPRITSSAMGVKIYIPERKVIAWTSPTHAWVPTQGQKKSWMTPVVEAFRRLCFWRMHGRGRAVGQSKEDIKASPLGKVIYYEGTQEIIGAVSHIYDLPSVKLPYPHGYRHDLAVITGPELPLFSQPPNCAKLLTKFATPEEALKAGTVFLLTSNFRRSKPGTLDVLTGHVVAPVARDALVMGVQTIWAYTYHLEAVNSLIWRSDDKDVNGASGSLLCLGSNLDKVFKGLVFQNFQGRYPGQSWQRDDKDHEEIKGMEARATFKGGFFLPRDVQEGTLILDDDDPEETQKVFSAPTCIA